MCQNEKEGMVLNPHGEAMPAGNIAEEGTIELVSDVGRAHSIT